MRHAIVVAVVLLAAPLCGCGRDAVAPLAITPPPPPIVEEMFPAPRSERIFYGTTIWARFAEPLDPMTIGEQTVFLKVDTRRIPADVTWDAAGSRIVIAPHEELHLNTTHTVRLSAEIRTAIGVALEHEVSWQFKTMSVRFPVGDWPPEGAAGKGPWTHLSWRGSEPEAGNITYRVYAGTDRATVEARTTPIFEHWVPIYRPDPGWPLGATVFWTVSAVNATTGEIIDGPIGFFDTLPDDTPIDSLDVPPSEWGYFNAGLPNQHPCYGDMTTGNGYTAAVRYPLTGLHRDLELADARIDAQTLAAQWPFLSISNATMWAARNPWTPCDIVTGFPTHDTIVGELSVATVLTGGRLRFGSPAFFSHLQQKLLSGAPFELVVRSDRTLGYAGWMGGTTEARLRIRYYRMPPIPAGALARGTGGS